MTSTRSRLIVLAHLLAFIILSGGLVFVLMERNMLFVPITLALLIVGVAMSLMRYLDTMANDLARFLLSIREGAFMDERGRKSSQFLNDKFGETLNNITREFARVSMEKELQYQYFRTLNENIGAGIISVDNGGTIRMVNPAAKQILGINQLQKLSDVQRVDANLYALLVQMDPEQSELYKLNADGEEVQLSVQMKEMVVNNITFRIFLIQNINNEIGQKEIEAWQQLTRVLTHEIMNSITPIAALSKAAQTIVQGNGATKKLDTLTDENLSDIADSVNTIASRSEGLIKFVNSYRSFTRQVTINRAETDMVFLVAGIVKLLDPEAARNGITIRFAHPSPPVLCKVDVALMEQAVINLLKNAIESILPGKNGMVTVELSATGRRVTLLISDNGRGMDEAISSKIFIPFFTTKARGSGVGLSLARQIILAHRGSIKVKSEPGKGSSFYLEWRMD